MTNTML